MSIILNSPECIVLDTKVFEIFTLADEPFAKARQIFETCVSVNNSLCGKLVLTLKFLIRLDERLKITSVPFFFSRFLLVKLWIRQFYWVTLNLYYIKTK